MSKFRFLLADLGSKEILEEMPFGPVSFSTLLNGAGELTTTCDLKHPKVTRQTLAEGRRMILVEKDDEIVWSGILWSARKTGAREVSVVAGGMFSYLDRRLMLKQVRFESVGELLIAEWLIEEANDHGLDIVADPSPPASTVRSLAFDWWEAKKIGEALTELADAEDGFDFDVVAGWNGNTIEVRWLVWEPRRGRADSGVVLEIGRNVSDYSPEYTPPYSMVVGLGAGDGSATGIWYADNALAVPGQPWLMRSEKFDIEDNSMLAAKTQALANAYGAKIPAMSVELRPGSDPQPGDVGLGDTVRVVVDDGWENVDSSFRVVAMKTDLVVDNTMERTTLALVDELAVTE